MPRRPRIHFKGAIFHVIIRGNNGRKIFHDAQDYKKYISLLAEYIAIPGNLYFILAYALMNTHVHLLIEVRDRPLSELMKIVQQRYTQYYHKKYNTSGHIFQGRYKAFIVENNQYLMVLFRYIHRNPCKAGLEESPGSNYPWTGHFELISNKLLILSKDRMLSYFHEVKSKAVSEYLRFVLENIDDDINPEELYANPDEILLRSESCSENKLHISTERLLEIVAKNLFVTTGEIKSPTKKSEVIMARKIFIFIAKRFLNISGSNLAKLLGVSQETISRTYQKALHRQSYDKELNVKIGNVLENAQKIKPDPD